MGFVVTASAVGTGGKSLQLRKNAAKAATTKNPFVDSGVGGFRDCT
jgi:hypothetical protein